ncbi:MAG: transcription antitermination factor NusB [Candidatus Peregrinibacteria bacterium]
MSYRHRARSAAVQCLSGITLRGVTDAGQQEEFLRFVKAEFLPTTKEVDLYETLITDVLLHRAELDEALSKNAPQWVVEKMAVIDRVLLEMGIYELLKTNTPHAIVMNEYIELAKEFGDDGTPAFINGVLSTIAKTLPEPEEKGKQKA